MTFLPYILDILALVLVVGTAVQAYRKGFVRAALNFLPMVAALAATRFLTPTVSELLRKTPFFDALTNTVGNGLHLENAIGDAAMQTQTEIIESMHLPDFLKESLVENNNPVIYHLLDVESLQSYIAGFLANICINIISVLLVFVVVWLAVKFVLKTLNLISKLPVLNFFNRACGFLVGLLKGLCVAWLICFVLTFFQCNSAFDFFFDALNLTHVALPLYENNILMYFILTIFA